jgi:hypothetical protein
LKVNFGNISGLRWGYLLLFEDKSGRCAVAVEVEGGAVEVRALRGQLTLFIGLWRGQLAEGGFEM